ncbi:hypothetical protein HGA91_01730 [candidate division WWE3 bacterium]|nr:hypothetical protein [candidate division WWE3 bacterium]
MHTHDGELPNDTPWYRRTDWVTLGPYLIALLAILIVGAQQLCANIGFRYEYQQTTSREVEINFGNAQALEPTSATQAFPTEIPIVVYRDDQSGATIRYFQMEGTLRRLYENHQGQNPEWLMLVKSVSGLRGGVSKYQVGIQRADVLTPAFDAKSELYKLEQGQALELRILDANSRMITRSWLINGVMVSSINQPPQLILSIQLQDDVPRGTFAAVQ